ncbi:PAS domain-containing sensor histidine kinase [Rudanella lutea]|uniref:PAS domain-containing sensor histidine kinase n=1 Tax=Rudanella lutea TaxID=451374 RepID=UPI000375102F|nr:PAS domain-containing sensor histidine kinase [Rudanella lutea]
MNRLLASVFMQAPSAMAVVKWPDLTFVFTNSPYQKLFRRSSGQLNGRSMREVWPDSAAYAIDEVGESGKPLTIAEYPIQVQTPDGDDRVLYFQFVFQPVAIEGETPTHLVIQATDVSEQVYARQQLEQSQDRFGAAIAAVQGTLWTNNPRGEMEGTQPGWAALTGQSYEEYQGYGWSRVVHPDDALPTIQAWNEAVRERRMFVFEHRVRAKGGRWGQFTIRAIPLFDREGTIREWVGVHTDVTQQRQAEAALRESEERFRIMADAAPTLVWTCNPDGSFKYMNPQVLAYLGMSEAQFLPSSYTDLLHPDERVSVGQAFRQAIQTLKPYTLEHRLRKQDGSYRWFLAQGAPSQYPNGELFAYVGSWIDIHEQKLSAERLEQEVADRTRELVKLNRALERSNEYLQQFAYVASHDLQEPLRKIQYFGGHVLEQYGQLLPTPAQDLLRRMQNASVRMANLIRDLLAYSKLSTQSLSAQPQNFEPVSLGEVVAEVLTDLELTIQTRNAQIDVGELPTLLADRTQMQQLLSNLMGNALKYTRPDTDPVVQIGSRLVEAHASQLPASLTQSDKPYWEIWVADNGIGFGEKYLDKLFQMFGRLHGRSQYEGSGIGLATCKRVAENHNGAITARSEPGQGATFLVYLPA